MNKPMLPGGDTLPWYQQFWPWFLIILPGTVVVASLTMLVIASRGADDLVVDDYYKDGLAINQRIEKSRRAAVLGIEAQLLVGSTSIRVAVAAPSDPQQLELHLSHPLEADDDFSITLARVAPGEYAGRLTTPIAPRWHWWMEPPAGDWRLDGIVSPVDMADERGP